MLRDDTAEEQVTPDGNFDETTCDDSTEDRWLLRWLQLAASLHFSKNTHTHTHFTFESIV